MFLSRAHTIVVTDVRNQEFDAKPNPKPIKDSLTKPNPKPIRNFDEKVFF